MAIAKLSIDLEARFAKFEQDLRSIDGRISTIGGNLKNAFVGVAAAVGGTQLASAFKGVVDSLDKIDESAERLNTSAENMSALGYAAKMNGIEVEELNKAMAKFTGLLADGQAGNKEAVETLTRLGVSAKNFGNVEAAFSQFADTIGKTDQPIKRSGLLIDALGEKIGLKFGPMLANGSAGLAEMRAEAEKLGAVIDGKVAKQAAEFNDNLDRLSALSGAAAKSIVGSLLPGLNQIAESFIISRKNADSLWEALSRPLPGTAFVDIQANLTKVRHEYEQLDFRISNGRAKDGDEARFAKLERELAYWQQISDAQNKPDAKPASRNLTTNNVPVKSGKSTKDKSVSFQDYDATLIERINKALESTDVVKADELAAALAKLDQLAAAGLDPALVDATRASLTGYSQAVEAASEAMVKNRQDMIDQINAAEEQGAVYGLTAAQISAVEQARLTDAIAMAEQNGASEEHLAYLRDELALRGRLTDALSNVDRAAQAKADAEGAIKALDSFEQYGVSAAKNIQSALADFLFEPAKGGFEEMAANFGKTIQRMIAEAAAAQLAKSLFGTMGQATAGGGAGSWGWVGQAASWAASFFADGGVMTAGGPVALRRYAGGGIANSPQLAMFGEGSTPEAYVPLPDGRRIPVAMHGGGGMTINQTIYAGAGTDSAQVRRSAASGARSALAVINGAKRYA